MFFTEQDFIKSLQEDHKDNSIIKIAVANGRDYATPEDIDIALETTDPDTLRRDALELLGDNTGYGVEDKKLFAQLATQAESKDKGYDISKHGDFKKYYDTTQKRNCWVLGYFGGGSVNILEAYELAKQMATTLKLPIQSIRIDEILKSRRYKGFKFMYSNVPDQQPEADATQLENVYQYLTD